MEQIRNEQDMDCVIRNMEKEEYSLLSDFLYEILYLIFDYPHKHYTFKHFEV